jgi:hypothetical protein
MTYEQAKREMDAAERRVMQLQANCTVAVLPAYRVARREFDLAARVAHDALWQDIQERQLQAAVAVPLVTSSHMDDLRSKLEEVQP